MTTSLFHWKFFSRFLSPFGFMISKDSCLLFPTYCLTLSGSRIQYLNIQPSIYSIKQELVENFSISDLVKLKYQPKESRSYQWILSCLHQQLCENVLNYRRETCIGVLDNTALQTRSVQGAMIISYCLVIYSL